MAARAVMKTTSMTTTTAAADSNTAAAATKYIEQLVSSGVRVCVCARYARVCIVYVMYRESSSRVYFYHCELTKYVK